MLLSSLKLRSVLPRWNTDAKSFLQKFPHQCEWVDTDTMIIACTRRSAHPGVKVPGLQRRAGA